MKKTEQTTETGKRRVTSKQVVAMIGVILLVLLYIVTFIAAILDNSASGHLFWVCLYATVVLPILIWIYTWMYGRLTRKHTFADPDIASDPVITADPDIASDPVITADPDITSDTEEGQMTEQKDEQDE